MNKNMEISEKQVKIWVDIASYERGEEYLEDEMIYEMLVFQNTLYSKCQGSSYSEYTLTCTIDDNHIVQGRCSCPVGKAGRCKHIVALLLEWIQNPDEFIDRGELTVKLNNLDKHELVKIISNLILLNMENFAIVENKLF